MNRAEYADSVLRDAQNTIGATCGVGLAILALRDLLDERLPKLKPEPPVSDCGLYEENMQLRQILWVLADDGRIVLDQADLAAAPRNVVTRIFRDEGRPDGVTVEVDRG